MYCTKKLSLNSLKIIKIVFKSCLISFLIIFLLYLTYYFTKVKGEILAAKNGDKVKVHYTGMLENGTVFDSSEGSEPLEFVIGKGYLIEDFENAVIGMEINQEKDVKISKDNAYGEPRQDLIFEIPREEVEDDVQPGEFLFISNGDNRIPVKVLDVKDSVVIIDANHPLAGHDLLFKIRLVEIL